jgi:hypothetical protein
MPIFLKGLGCTTGDTIGTLAPLITGFFQSVYYVHYTNGVDDGNHGISREAPWKTLGYAVTQLAGVAGQTIILMDGHDEVLTTTVTISDDIAIIGEGSSGGIPTASLAWNNSTGSAILVNDASTVVIGNIRFKKNVQANSSAMISLSCGAHVIFRNNYVECGQYDVKKVSFYDPGTMTDHGAYIADNNTWKSVATVATALPTYAMYFANGASPQLAKITGDVFDGMTYGWSGDAIQCQYANVLIAENISLIRGADIRQYGSDTYWVTIPSSSGVARSLI